MCESKFDFSVIIPHRNSLHFLSKLFLTLPDSEKVEIILVDNSDIPIKKEEVQTDREFKLLYSSPDRGAGGARNVGIDNANGKWFIFVDADDYLTDDAFEIFYSQFNSDAEVIYFGVGGIYYDTGDRSERGDTYTRLVRDYLYASISEMDIRLGYVTPYSKMVSSELVKRKKIRYDEVLASNDVYFSLLSGYYAEKIDAVDKVTYIATVSKGSLTKRRDFEVISSRYIVNLRRNKFLKEHGLSKYQSSIMIFLFEARKFGVNKLFFLISLLFKYKQNPFIGMNRWFKTFLSYSNNSKRDQKYIIN